MPPCRYYLMLTRFPDKKGAHPERLCMFYMRVIRV